MRVLASLTSRTVLGLLLALGAPVAASAQGPASAAPAAELVSLMEARKIDAVAARHPSREGAFVAALHFPGQLLVVWADYPVPVLLNEKLLNGAYREIYIDLNSASDPATKTLVTDMGADGLHPRRDGDDPFDMQDSPSGAVRFDGRWRDQKLNEQAYMKIYSASDAAYAEALGALVAQLKGGGNR